MSFAAVTGAIHPPDAMKPFPAMIKFFIKNRCAPLLAGICLALAGATGELTAAELKAGDDSETVAAAEPATKASSTGKRDVERHFETLAIGALTYTNVWLHRQTNFNILIRHAGGIETVKLTDLPKDELAALRPQLGDLANIAEAKEPQLVSRFKEMEGSEASEIFKAKLEEQFEILIQRLPTLLLPVLISIVLLHLVSSFFIYAICKKTKTKTGFEVWLPVVNQTALLRAAGLPGVWALLGFMAPLLPVAVFTLQLLPVASLSGLIVVGISGLFSIATGIVWIVWCFKICIAREKSGWLGILLLIPGVNVLTITYLAFAD